MINKTIITENNKFRLRVAALEAENARLTAALAEATERSQHQRVWLEEAALATAREEERERIIQVMKDLGLVEFAETVRARSQFSHDDSGNCGYEVQTGSRY
jgi:NAD(P)H-nitrite reductase large subunit